MSLRLATSELKHRQLQQREYAASVAAHSLRGFVAARDQYFEAERRRQSPPPNVFPMTASSPSSSSLSSTPSPTLMRSTIRSPPVRKNETIETEANANVIARNRNDEPEQYHPRRHGRNGTPAPDDIRNVAPMTRLNDDGMKSEESKRVKSREEGKGRKPRGAKMFAMSSL